MYDSAETSASSSPVYFSVGEDRYFSPSPKLERVVANCRNCNFSYRLNSRNSSEFCSKDCQTCFMLFYKISTPTKPAEKTAAEIRHSIYNFQQKIDDDHHQTQVKKPRDPAKRVDVFPPLEKEPKQPTTAEGAINTKGGGVRYDLLNAIFTSPRPARPQLHAFF